MSNTVIHFGAGALGKGLVIPVLHDSGLSVTVVDADAGLVDFLNKEGQYHMYILDDAKNPVRQIPIKKAFHLIHDQEQLIEALRQTDIVTTSVRRENLPSVAALLAVAWGQKSNNTKLVICCENVENVSSLFRDALLRFAEPQNVENLLQVKIPDTVVDRGCSANPSEPYSVLTESFYEIGVDEKAVPDTGISQIPSIPNLRQCFYRKRFLMNTRADLLSYFAMEYGLRTFGEAVHSQSLQDYLAPYQNNILREALIKEFSMAPSEYENWNSFYLARLQKSDAKSDTRPLNTIARGMWDKLSYKERIFYPVVLCKKHNCNVSAGISLLADIVQIQKKSECLSNTELIEKLKKLWCLDQDGQEIFNQIISLWKERY